MRQRMIIEQQKENDWLIELIRKWYTPNADEKWLARRIRKELRKRIGLQSYYLSSEYTHQWIYIKDVLKAIGKDK